MFLFYKSFLSSQDAISCVFHPSCSVYGFQTIQKMALSLACSTPSIV
ncbi:MAG: membrane protein insertion efficiency factor YidD [Bacteroidales bacterium]|nr:membrane protein insertion efficiency factor YidD [Bacteroidales bacterium]